MLALVCVFASFGSLIVFEVTSIRATVPYRVSRPSFLETVSVPFYRHTGLFAVTKVLVLPVPDSTGPLLFVY